MASFEVVRVIDGAFADVPREGLHVCRAGHNINRLVHVQEVNTSLPRPDHQRPDPGLLVVIHHLDPSLDLSRHSEIGAGLVEARRQAATELPVLLGENALAGVFAGEDPEPV